MRFLGQLTFNVALAMYVQRVGDRNNDCKCSGAGRYKFFNMFFGFNHPIYREVEYNELRQKVLLPQEISAVRNNNISYSTKSNAMGHNNEGGDFKLENKIKQIKALTPKGKKDAEMWKKIIRCSKDVTKVVKHGRRLLGLDQQDGDRQDNNIPLIVKWRAYLRHSKYLEVDTPYVTSIDGERLNDSLADFSHILDKKRSEFWDQAREGTKLQSIRYTNINIVENDDDDISCYGDGMSDTDDAVGIELND